MRISDSIRMGGAWDPVDVASSQVMPMLLAHVTVTVTQKNDLKSFSRYCVLSKIALPVILNEYLLHIALDTFNQNRSN